MNIITVSLDYINNKHLHFMKHVIGWCTYHDLFNHLQENVSHKVPQDLDLVGRGLTVGEQTTLSTVQAVQERVPPPCSIGTQRDLFVQVSL